MQDRRAVKRKRRAPWVVGGFALISLSILVLLQTSNLWKSFSVETASDTLLLYALSSLNFIALIVFGFIFLRSIVKLVRERRAVQLGSRLKTKLVVYFAAVSLLPILAMAGFSYLFMNRALERWFTSIPENIVRAPLEIEARANAERSSNLQETANVLAAAVGSETSAEALDNISRSGGLSLVAILSVGGEILVSGPIGQDLNAASELALIRAGRIDDASLKDGIGFDAAEARTVDGHRLVVVRSYPETESVAAMVDRTLAEFDRMKESNVSVRQIGLLTLGVLTFLLIFASSWTAFYIARGLTGPIRALAEGAQEIAHGKLGHQVTVFAEDELSLLVSSFNEMSSKLEANSNELADRKRYIETVLLSLPTGVVSVDRDNRVGTINPAARTMLGLTETGVTGSDLSVILSEEDRIEFERLIARARRVGHASDQTKLRRTSTPTNGLEGMSIAITATALPEDRGVVLVLEDLSELIAAQRASAWQEVARRMAHEIKNPLTPIQLSAERIAKRFASVQPVVPGGTPSEGRSVAVGGVFADDANTTVVLDGTETILREVQGLKAMVDEFSRFARLPAVRLEQGNLNEVVEQAISLYTDREDASFDLRLAPDLPLVMLDHEQLKRVFVNLIDNAIEAPRDGEDPLVVVVATRLDTARDLLVAEVSDNGCGIHPADFQKLFQPYFSTKGRGTGLGLAIVNRIVTDHHGRIKAVQNHPRGAKFIMEFPALT